MTLSPNAPRTVLSAPPHVERKVAARWAEWLPWMKIEAQRLDLRGESAAFLKQAQEIHRTQLLMLLALGITMPTIRRCSLDDPRVSHAERQARAERYMAKAAVRKTYTRRKNASTEGTRQQPPTSGD